MEELITPSNIKPKLISDIKFFNKLNIDLCPINVKLPNNTKKSFSNQNVLNDSKWWKIDLTYSVPEMIASIKGGNVGYLIKCNDKSNLCILDFDIKDNLGNLKPQTTDSKNLLNLLLSSGTLTIQTPSGGYHFIFKKNENISKNHIQLFGFLDVKTKTSIVFAGLRSDGYYNIIDKAKPILDVSSDILDFIEKGVIDKITSKDTDYTNKIEILKEDGIDIKCPVDILDLFNHKPMLSDWNINNENIEWLFFGLNKSFLIETKKWLLITTIARKYGLYELWDKWSKSAGAPYYDLQNNLKKWHMIDNKKTLININYLTYLHNIDKTPIQCNTELVKLFYGLTSKTGSIKNKLPFIERIYNEYTPLNDNNKKRFNISIETKYLNTDLYKNVNNQVVLLIKSGLGTGKTYTTFTFIIENNYKLLSISHSISLVESQFDGLKTRASQLGKSTPVYTYKDPLERFPDNASVITTIDSLVSTVAKMANINEYYIYIDEIHRVLEYLISSDTLGTKRDNTYYTLIEIVKKCKGLIGTDGHITDCVFSFCDMIQKDTYAVVNTYKSFNNVPVHMTSNKHNTLVKMKKLIDNKKVFTCCCNTKKDTVFIKDFLLKNGVERNFIKIYTSDESTPVHNVNIEWHDKYIVYSPKIVEGVDRTSLEPEFVFAFYDGIFTLTPEQVMQQLFRNRNILEIWLLITNDKNIKQYSDLQDCYSKHIAINDNHLLVTNNNLVKYLDKKTVDFKPIYTTNPYVDVFISFEYSKSTLNNNRKYILKEMLKNSGCIVNDDIKNHLINFMDINTLTDDDYLNQIDSSINIKKKLSIEYKNELYEVYYKYLKNEPLPAYYNEKKESFIRKEPFINEIHILESLYSHSDDVRRYIKWINNYLENKKNPIVIDKVKIKDKYDKLKSDITEKTNLTIEKLKKDLLDFTSKKKIHWADMITKMNNNHLNNKKEKGTKEAVNIKNNIKQQVDDEKKNIKEYTRDSDIEIKKIKQDADRQKIDLTRQANNELKPNNIKNNTDNFDIYTEMIYIKYEYIFIIREIYIDQPFFRLLLLLKTEFLISDKYLAKKDYYNNANDQIGSFKYTSCFAIICYRAIMRKYFKNLNIYNPEFNTLGIDDFDKEIELTDEEYKGLKSNFVITSRKPTNIQQLIIFIGKVLNALFEVGDYLYKTCSKVIHNKDTNSKIKYTFPSMNMHRFKAFILIINNSILPEDVHKYDDVVKELYNITGCPKCPIENKHIHHTCRYDNKDIMDKIGYSMQFYYNIEDVEFIYINNDDDDVINDDNEDYKNNKIYNDIYVSLRLPER
jgi:hypothetical protein